MTFFHQALGVAGVAPAGTPEEFRSAHRDEKAKWAPIVMANNIELD